MTVQPNILQRADEACQGIHHAHNGASSSSRIRSDHRYGMFITLKPSSESVKLLSRITNATSNLLKQLHLNTFQKTEDPNLHLTIATPLKPLSEQTIVSILEIIRESKHAKPLTSNLKMDEISNGGNYSFNFGSSDGNPYITLKMFTNENKLQENKVSRTQAKNLAKEINSFCKTKDLFSLDKLKPFKPHVTLGRFSSDEVSQKPYLPGYEVHLRESHAPELTTPDMPKEKSLSARVRDTFNNTENLSIEFDKLEILLVDKMKGEKHSGYQTVASIDLKTKKITTFPVQSCKHKIASKDPLTLTKLWNNDPSPIQKLKCEDITSSEYVDLNKKVCKSGQTLYMIKEKDIAQGDAIYHGPYTSLDDANIKIEALKNRFIPTDLWNNDPSPITNVKIARMTASSEYVELNKKVCKSGQTLYMIKEKDIAQGDAIYHGPYASLDAANTKFENLKKY